MLTSYTNEAGQPITLGQLIFRTAVYGCGLIGLAASWDWTTVLFFCM